MAFFSGRGYLLSFFAYFFAGAFFVSLPPFFWSFDAYYYYSFLRFCYYIVASFVSNYIRFLDINSPSFYNGFLNNGWTTDSQLKIFEFFKIYLFFNDHNGYKSTNVPPIHSVFIFIYFLSSRITFCYPLSGSVYTWGYSLYTEISIPLFSKERLSKLAYKI